MAHVIHPSRTVFFCCDIQTKFQSAIYGWPQVIHTAEKMVRFAKILDIPVLTTEQNPKALGPTDPSVGLSSLPSYLNLGTFPKTKFSMVLPETLPLLKDVDHVVLFGIEAHICVLQTALELLAPDWGVKVHVLADGVSSCNPEEVGIALDRLRSAGAIITTSESLLFQIQHDASKESFRPFTKEVKEVKEATKDAMKVLGSLATGGVVAGSKL
ncbi:Isochorismatase-like protein [Mrakia frigida]|uniref:Isochorismatase-like protein n=1 Tax=Mrakia frigida TaxID=29902 RepID=UPI003FCC01FA